MTSKFSFFRINSPKIFHTHMRNFSRKPIPFTNRDEIPWRGVLYNLSKNFLAVWRDPSRYVKESPEARGKGTLPNYQSYFCWWRTDLHLNKPAVSHRDCRGCRSRRGKGSLVRLSSPRNQKRDQFNRVSTLLLVLLSCLLSSSPALRAC